MFVLNDDTLLRIRKFFKQDFFHGSREKLTLYIRKEGHFVLFSIISVEKKVHVEFHFPYRNKKIVPTIITISRRIFYREVNEIICSSVGSYVRTKTGDYELEYNTLSLQGIKNFNKYTYTEADILNKK